MNFRANQPFVGKSAFAHKGGMHVSGIARSTASYEHIDPQLVGNERRILVSELSGRANIAALTDRHGIADDPKLLEQILAKVVSMENAGYQFEAADASFNLLVRKCMNKFQPHFEPLHYSVIVDNKIGEVRAEAAVKMLIGDEVRFEAAEGDGPIDALNAAAAQGAQQPFPRLEPSAPGRLQGAGDQFRGRHGRRRPRDHRKPGRKRRVGHRRSERKHHRGKLDCLA